MDPHPFTFLDAGGRDVLMLFDYRDMSLPDELMQTVAAYDDGALIAWSLGVAVANLCGGDWVNRFRIRMAINGTVRPVDREEGIAPEIFDGTIRNLDERGLARFIKRTCVAREVHHRYLAQPAQRPLAEIREELQVLRSMALSNDCIFTHALAGRDDRIFSYANQVRCWDRNGVPCTTVDVPHFPFYAWRTWKEVLHACDAN